MGVFEGSRFYPDFILWIKNKDSQRIVFIEPHGMLNAKAYMYDDKAQLHECLPELAAQIATRSANLNVELDAFIVSVTTYEDLKERYGEGHGTKEDFAAKHILFQIRDSKYDYIEQILQR